MHHSLLFHESKFAVHRPALLQCQQFLVVVKLWSSYSDSKSGGALFSTLCGAWALTPHSVLQWSSVVLNHCRDICQDLQWQEQCIKESLRHCNSLVAVCFTSIHEKLRGLVMHYITGRKFSLEFTFHYSAHGRFAKFKFRLFVVFLRICQW